MKHFKISPSTKEFIWSMVAANGWLIMLAIMIFVGWLSSRYGVHHAPLH